ncbi:MAG: cob(I)alamin adenosyltransferase [Parcubacteria group bacterium Gr01-1014_106]|nr:MAG: cob(I)alamin adenosyltransferase [Parcubacteria group bacterium Gr01-1014_106]
MTKGSGNREQKQDGPKRGRVRPPRVSDRGLTIVYYGDGKGKTTAALGAVLRAVGQGWHCAVIQFIKGSWPSSERTAIPQYLSDRVTIEAGGKGFVGIIDDRLPRSEHKKQAQQLFRKVQKLFRAWGKGQGAWRRRGQRPKPHSPSPVPQLVVLDEILDAVEFGFLTQTDIVRLMKTKPTRMHLVLTGHKKFPKVFAAADLVTRMAKEKHPYDKGFLAVRGLDF